MRRSLYFLVMCVMVIAPTIACGFVVTRNWLIWVILAVLMEVLLIYVIHRHLFYPLRVISNGMDLLREQDFSSRLKKVGQPDADRMVTLFNDMMERLKVQNLQVQEQNEFLNLLIEASPMGVIILNDSEDISLINKAACAMLGTDRPASLSELKSPLGAALSQLEWGQTRTVRLGGQGIFRCSRLHFMDRGWPHPFILIESLTEEVRAAEKQALTRVIRTMSHEVNNSMAGILSTLDTLSEILGENPSTASLVPTLKACSDRSEAMAGFIRQFAEVVKVPEPTLCLTDFSELVHGSRIILESLCSISGATLMIDVENASPVKMDMVLMQQALVNVVKNAAESAGNGGVVQIVADECSLRVIDNGPGLAPDAQEHLFSALYTTKPGGQGLGLMLVAEILQRHGADYSLHTDSGLTEFKITLDSARARR